MVDAFSEAQIEDFKEAFSAFDVDGDGTITTEELGVCFANLGSPATEDELQEMIAEVDEDGSGAIDFDEFLELMAKRAGGASEEDEQKSAYKMFDKENKGYFELKDIIRVMTNLSMHRFTEGECQAMMEEYDETGATKGQVTMDEFVVMLNKPKP